MFMAPLIIAGPVVELTSMFIKNKMDKYILL